MKQETVLTTDQVRESLIRLSGYRVSENDAKFVINALRELNVKVDEKSLETIANVKKKFRNFKWSNTQKVFKTIDKFKNVQPMTLRDLKLTLRQEGIQTAKISKLIKLANLSNTDRFTLIPAKTCLNVLIRSALFEGKPYIPNV